MKRLLLLSVLIVFVSMCFSQDYLIQNKQPKPDFTPGFYFKQSSDYLLGSIGCMALAGVSIAAATSAEEEGTQNMMYGIGAGLGLASIVLQVVGYIKLGDAGRMMMQIENNEKVSVTFQPTSHGVGFVCRLK